MTSYTLSTLVSFTGSGSGNGKTPLANLVVDAAGDLIGTTELGGSGLGSVFEIKNTGTAAAPVYGTTPTTLATFSATTGDLPASSLFIDGAGNLIGTADSGGGSGKKGTVFEIKNTGTVANPTYSSTVGVITAFSSTGGGGSFPNGNLVADSAGDLYGTTQNGGALGYGAVFEILNIGSVATPIYAGSATTLFSFTNPSSASVSGAYPQAGLAIDSDGDLFGTTSQGGTGYDGTVFEMVNVGTVAHPVYGSSPTTIIAFDGSGGFDPTSQLLVDASGNLFGTTDAGGPGGSGYGTVFEIANTGTVAHPVYASTVATIASFSGAGTAGEYPEGNLTEDSAGDIFGTTEEGGGSKSDGLAYEIVNSGTVAAPVYASGATTIATFTGANGALPLGGLLLENGVLYGTTQSGGAKNDGEVYALKAASPPTVTPESATLLAGATASGSAGAGGTGALKGDSDPNGGALSVTSVTYNGTTDTITAGGSATIAGAYGTLTLYSTGAYSYAASNGLAIVSAANGQPIADTFIDTVTASEGASAPSSLAITISLAAGGAETVNDASGSATYSIGATSLTLANDKATTFSGVIQDGSSGNTGGKVFISGQGGSLSSNPELTLSGASTYTGGTYVSGTEVLVGNASAFGTGAVHVSNAYLAYGQGGTYGNAISLEAASPGASSPTLLTANGSYTVTISGQITTGSGLNAQGYAIDPNQVVAISGQPGSVFILSNTSNSWTGGTLVIGTLEVTAAGEIGAGAISLDGGALLLNTSYASPMTMSQNIVVETNGYISVQGGEDILSGAISDSGAGSAELTKSGVGVLVLTGADSYSGGTEITQGVLDLGGGGATGSILGNVDIESYADLAFDRSTALQFSGVISGAGTVIKEANGALTLSGNNSYSGGTELETGTLDIASQTGAGTGAISFTPIGGSVNGEVLAIEAAALNAGGQFANTVSGFSAGATIDVRGVGLATSASLSGGALTLSNAGGTLATVQLSNLESGLFFKLSADSSSGTDITLISDPGPTITSAATASVVEGTPVTAPVYVATATDVIGTPISYSLSGADASLLAINATTGVVTLDGVADYQAKSGYSFNVVASDGTLTSTQTVTLGVVDVAPTITSAISATVVEGSPVATPVYTATAADVVGSPVTFSLNGADASLLAINATTGVVTLDGVADYQTKSGYSFNVVASDGTLTSTQTVTLGVVDVAPTITSATSATVVEGSPVTTPVYTATAADVVGSPVAFSLNGADASLLAINATTGAVTLDGVANYQAKSSYSFNVVASDGTLTSTQAVTLGVADVAPTITSATSATVVEGSPVTTPVYTATAADVVGSPVAFSLNGADASLLAINATTGVVTLDGVANYQAKSGYSFNVVASDGTLTSTQTVTLGVVDVAPTITSAATASVVEGSAVATPVYTATASDVVGSPISYSLSGDDASLLAINATTGVVTLDGVANYQAKSGYSFNVVASDGTLTSTQAVTLGVIARPTIAYAPASLTATVGSNVAVTPYANVALGDANPGADDSVTLSVSGAGTLADGMGYNGLTKVGVSGATTSYTISGLSAAKLTQEVDALVFTPGINTPNTQATTQFYIAVQSSAGTSASVTPAVSAVTSVDPAVAPTISGAVARQTTISEAAVNPFSTVTVSDLNNGGVDVDTLTITQSGAGLLSGQGLAAGAMSGSYVLTGTAATITAELDALTFTPATGTPNASASTSFTLSDMSAAGPAGSAGGIVVVDSDPAVAPTIAGTVATQTTTSEAAVNPFSTVTVSDLNNGGGDVDTLTITQNGAGLLSGQGLSATSGGYTLTGTAAAITAQLDKLTFTPVDGTPNTSVATSFTLSDLSSADAVAGVAPAVVVKDSDPAVSPIISGATAGQIVGVQGAIKPFASVVINDPNVGTTDAISIQLTGGGALSGAGLSATATAGRYVLAATSAANATAELQALVYTPAPSAAHSAQSVGFTLTDMTSAGTTATNGVITLIVDPGPTAGAVAAKVAYGTTGDNLTALILAAATSGLKGDVLTITADATASTLGAVTLVNGQLVYSANTAALSHIPANGSQTDSVGYTLSDAYGDVATGTVNLTVTNTADVINGPAYGDATIQGAAGADVINAYGYFNTIFDNGGNDLVNAGLGNATVYAGAGDVVALLQGYFDTVSGGGGNDSVTSSAGNATVTLGNGADVVSTGGFTNHIVLGSGTDVVNAGLGASSVSLGGGNDSVTIAGYTNTITAGNGADVVTGGSGQETITLGNGADQVKTSGYGNVITVGSGADTIVAGSGLDTVAAGAGVDTIKLSGQNNTVVLNGATANVSGGQGVDSVTASGGADTLTFSGWNSQATLSGVINADIVDLGDGLRINVGSSTQTDVITGFGGSDPYAILDLQHGAGGYSSAAAAFSALRSDGHGESLSLGGGYAIDFAGAALSQLHVTNFCVG